MLTVLFEQTSCNMDFYGKSNQLNFQEELNCTAHHGICPQSFGVVSLLAEFVPLFSK